MRPRAAPSQPLHAAAACKLLSGQARAARHVRRPHRGSGTTRCAFSRCCGPGGEGEAECEGKKKKKKKTRWPAARATRLLLRLAVIASERPMRWRGGSSRSTAPCTDARSALRRGSGSKVSSLRNFSFICPAFPGCMMMSAIDVSTSPCSLQKGRSCGERAPLRRARLFARASAAGVAPAGGRAGALEREPSSLTWSQSTPTSLRPARRQRSTDASVCCVCSSTPPGTARSRRGRAARSRRARRRRWRARGRWRRGRRPVHARRRAHLVVDRHGERGALRVLVVHHHRRQPQSVALGRPAARRRSARTRTAR